LNPINRWGFSECKLTVTSRDGGGILIATKGAPSTYEKDLYDYHDKNDVVFKIIEEADSDDDEKVNASVGGGGGGGSINSPVNKWASRSSLAFPTQVLYGASAVGDVNSTETAVDWVSFPGLFAGGKLDVMTAFLLTHLPPIQQVTSSLSLPVNNDASKPHTLKVMDFACGSGVIAYSLAKRQLLKQQQQAGGGTGGGQVLELDALDCDSIAVRAAKLNLKAFNGSHKLASQCVKTRVILSDSLNSINSMKYDAIVSNPPLHNGKLLDYSVSVF